MYFTPILMGGLSSFGIATLLSAGNLKKGAKAAVLGAGFQVARQVALTEYERRVERQLLYKLWVFKGTRLYGILSSGANFTRIATMTGGAATAGALIGATVGSVGAITAQKVGLISESQEQSALGFYTGGIRGDKPHYWNTDPNQSGYFNIPKNVKTIWQHYMG